MLVQVVIRADLTDEADQVGHRNIVALDKVAIDRRVRTGGRIKTHSGARDGGGRHPILVGCGAKERGEIRVTYVVNLAHIDAEQKNVAASLLRNVVHDVPDWDLPIVTGRKGVDVRHEAKVHKMRILQAQVTKCLTCVTEAEVIDP